MFLYFFKTLKRQPLPFLITFIAALVMAAALGILNTSREKLGREMEQVIADSIVSCRITNREGTQSDSLRITPGELALFLPDAKIPGRETLQGQEDPVLGRYLTNFKIKTSLQCLLGEEMYTVIGTNAPESVRVFRPEEGCTIIWEDGYNADSFDERKTTSGTSDGTTYETEREAVCLVSENLKKVTPGLLTLRFLGKEKEQEMAFRIVGSYTGEECGIYIPWQTAAQILTDLERKLQIDSLEAVFLDNFKIEAFREICYDKYFWKPGDTEDQSYTKRHAFAVYDEKLRMTVENLENHKRAFQLCAWVVLLLVVFTGYLLGDLMCRRREKLLALKRILGQSSGSIFLEMWVSQMVPSALGLAAGGLISGLTGFVPVFLAQALASMMAIILFLRKDPVRAKKEAE